MLRIILLSEERVGEMEEHSSNKLLVWVRLLYLTAGYLNALTLLLFGETAVGQTGRMTNLVYHAFQSNEEMVLSLFYLSGSFLLGAIAGGFIFPKDAFNIHHPIFGWASFFVGMGLIIFGVIPILNPYFIYFVCFVLGIQNSLGVKYKIFAVSSVVITSVFSNFGVSIAHYLRGDKSALGRSLYHGGNILCHVVGASFCCLFFLEIYELMIPFIVLTYAFMGFYYLKFKSEF